MIGVLLTAQILSADLPTVIAYEHVPAEVVRVQTIDWHGSRPGPSTVADRTQSRVAVRGVPSRTYVVTFVRADGSYLLDGPFPWPSADGVRSVPQRWQRTLRGAVPDDAAATSVEWVRADGTPGLWPMCFRDDSRIWSCWGILPESRGVVVLPDAGGMLWTAIGSTAPAELSRAAWGRLLVVTDTSASRSGVRVSFGRPVAPPAGRVTGIRLETAPVAGARSVSLAPGIEWIVGSDVPPKAWIEVATESAGPVYLALQDVAAAGVSVPVQIFLPERRVVSGRVFGATGEAAPGTLVTSFRLIDPPAVGDNRELPRRVLAAETVADIAGLFQIDGVGEADYEVVAWHALLGRASVPLPSSGFEMVIRLRASGLVRGRVLAGGQPVEGINVISVPDASTFTAASDITVVKGGDGRTQSDGRFTVMAAESGGGELRIGGGKYAVRRVTLPRPPAPVFDLGDIHLGEPIGVTVVLDRDPRCDVRAAGPVGRTGLQVMVGARTADGGFAFALPESGLWEFSLVCVGERRALDPGAVQIGPAQAGKELRFVVR